MIDSREAATREVLVRLVATDYARDVVARSLYEAVIDRVGFGPRDLPRPEDTEWLRGALSVALHDATDAALEVLVLSLARALVKAPNDLHARLAESHRLADLGLE
jgi:hypothetical protein